VESRGRVRNFRSHAYATFANHGLFGREWEERKIQEIMERERSERSMKPEQR
jgi:hypothetical protein